MSSIIAILMGAQAFAADYDGKIVDDGTFNIEQDKTLSGTIEVTSTGTLNLSAKLSGYPAAENGSLKNAGNVAILENGNLSIGTITNAKTLTANENSTLTLNSQTDIINEAGATITLSGTIAGNAKSFINRGTVNISNTASLSGADKLTITHETGFVQPADESFGEQSKQRIYQQLGEVNDDKGISDIVSSIGTHESVINEINNSDHTLHFIMPGSIDTESQDKISINLDNITGNALSISLANERPDGITGTVYPAGLSGIGTVSSDMSKFVNGKVSIDGEITIDGATAPANMEVSKGATLTISGEYSIGNELNEKGSVNQKCTHTSSGQTWNIMENGGKVVVKADGVLTIPAGATFSIGQTDSSEETITLPSDLADNGTGALFADYEKFMTVKDIDADGDSVTEKYATDGVKGYRVESDGTLTYLMDLIPADGETKFEGFGMALEEESNGYGYSVILRTSEGYRSWYRSPNIGDHCLVQNHRWFIPSEFDVFFSTFRNGGSFSKLSYTSGSKTLTYHKSTGGGSGTCTYNPTSDSWD